MLLITEKLKYSAYEMTNMFSPSSIAPTLFWLGLAAPSMYRVQRYIWPSSSTSPARLSFSSALYCSSLKFFCSLNEHSTMKSANTLAFIVVQGLYCKQ